LRSTTFNWSFYMKKNVLALSISAAVCSLGLVGAAHAITDLGVTGTVGAATSLKVNPDGIGHNVFVPYYTAQGANATLINLINHSATTSKVVKVRFRGATNSDDVLDFQVFLSPNDMWTAKISKSAAGGAQIETADKSCTKPAFTANSPVAFLTGRVDASGTASALAQTLEGYVEIFNMADATGALATAILHKNGVPADCSAAAMTTLDTNIAYVGGALAPLLALPTTGLSANWTIVNTATGAAYGGRAPAVHALLAGAPSTGNIVYWPQNNVAVAGETRGFTADPLLATAGAIGVGTVGAIQTTNQDLPDMSTPYVSGLTTAPAAVGTLYSAAAGYGAVTDSYAATAQAFALTSALAAVSVSNEFFSDGAGVTVGGATDWVFSMPTRRYNVALNYTTGNRVYTDYSTSYTGVAALPAKSNFFDATNTSVSSRVICISGITPTQYNREETTPAGGVGVTFSPAPATPTTLFCGETGVWAINVASPTASSVVLGALTVRGADTGYAEGWMNVAMPGLGAKGLPVLGVSFTKASSNPTTNFGANSDHRATRAAGYAY
jgi:hypothetical protein